MVLPSLGSVASRAFAKEDNADGYLAELNGKTFGATDYVFPSRTGGKAVSYNIELDNSVSGSISMKFVKQVGMRITLNVAAPTGIVPISIDIDQNAKSFNLKGQLVGKNNKGIIIKKGKKVIK